MIASFGGLVLRGGLIGAMPMQDFSREMSLDTEVQDQEGGKPSTLIKGPGLEQIQFTVVLTRQVGVTPETVIAQLQKLLEAGTAHTFVLGSRPIGASKWLLKSVSVSDVVINGRGQIVKAVAKLSLEEYVREGSKTSSAAASSGASGGPGVVGVNDAYKVQNPDAETKAALKRTGGFGSSR